MTRPICLSEVAPVSAIAASIGGVDLCLAGAPRADSVSMIVAFGLFLIGLFLAAALAEHLGGVDALLDELLDDGHFGGIVERLGRIDLGLLQRGFHHAERAQTGLFAAFHGRDHVLLHLIDEGHDV